MKNLIVMMAMLVTFSSAYSQFWVVKLGICESSVKFYDASHYSAKLGLSGGIIYNILLSKSFSLQPEVNFIQKGYRFSIQINDPNYLYSNKSVMRLSYLEAPLLFKLTSTYKRIQAFFEAGPYIGIGIGGSYLGVESINSTASTHFDRKVIFGGSSSNASLGNNIHFDNRFDTGVQFGVGALIFEALQIDLRFSDGLTNLNNSFQPKTANISKNRSLQLTFGIPIRRIKKGTV
jgi:hypothetical protein